MSHLLARVRKMLPDTGQREKLMYPLVGLLGFFTFFAAIWSAGIERYDYAVLLAGWLMFIQAALRAERHNDALTYRVSVLRRRLQEKDEVIRAMASEDMWLLQPQGDSNE